MRILFKIKSLRNNCYIQLKIYKESMRSYQKSTSKLLSAPSLVKTKNNKTKIHNNPHLFTLS